MVISAVQSIYLEGVSFDAYLDGVRANASEFHQVYERLRFVASDAESRVFQPGTRALVFCEPYCADCVINLPLIARLASASTGAELRVVGRDMHQAVADRFPGRDGISRVPTVILFDSQQRLIGYWSERGKSDHAWMEEFTRSDPLPDITLDDGIPVGDFAQWLKRRFAGQLPVFFEQNWKDVREELRVLAHSRSAEVGRVR